MLPLMEVPVCGWGEVNWPEYWQTFKNYKKHANLSQLRVICYLLWQNVHYWTQEKPAFDVDGQEQCWSSVFIEVNKTIISVLILLTILSFPAWQMKVWSSLSWPKCCLSTASLWRKVSNFWRVGGLWGRLCLIWQSDDNWYCICTYILSTHILQILFYTRFTVSHHCMQCIHMKYQWSFYEIPMRYFEIPMRYL